jgi:hypothetical protein
MYGKCLCGLVSFDIIDVVPKLYQCHCSLCRKQGGAPSNTAAIFAKKHFQWLSGHEHVKSWVKDTGFRSDFCSRYGSPVPNPLRTVPYYWVLAGLLEGDVQLEVAAHLYVDSRASWDTITYSGKQYETSPELSELLKLGMHG